MGFFSPRPTAQLIVLQIFASDRFFFSFPVSVFFSFACEKSLLDSNRLNTLPWCVDYYYSSLINAACKKKGIYIFFWYSVLRNDNHVFLLWCISLLHSELTFTADKVVTLWNSVFVHLFKHPLVLSTSCFSCFFFFFLKYLFLSSAVV